MEEFNNNNTPEKENENSVNAPIYIPTNSAPFYYAPKALDPDLLIKKEYKKVANRAAVGVLLLYCFSVIFQIIVNIVALIFFAKGQSAYKEFLDFYNAPSFMLLLNSFFQCLFMTIPFILAAVISKQRPSDILSYKKPKGIISLSIMGLGGAMLCNLANAIISAVFSIFGSAPQGSGLEMSYSLSSFFLNIITIAVIPALFEEFAFRGIMMGLLRKRFSASASIIISAAAFGLMHGNFSQMPFAFLMGLILGYLYAATGSLWVPMLVHFLNNAYSTCIDHISNALDSSSGNIVFYATLCVLLLMGIIAFVYIIKRKPEILHFEDEEKEISTPKMLKIAFSAPVFIIVAILYILDAVVKQIGGII